MESLREFISRRRKEIDAEASPLRERLTILECEWEELTRAEAAIGAIPMPPKSIFPAVTRGLQEARAPRGVIKRAVLKILSETTVGMDALAILRALNDRLGSNYQRTSLSPQLSRLKSDGLVRLDGTLWSVTNAGGEVAHWPVDLPDEDDERHGGSDEGEKGSDVDRSEPF